MVKIHYVSHWSKAAKCGRYDFMLKYYLVNNRLAFRSIEMENATAIKPAYPTIATAENHYDAWGVSFNQTSETQIPSGQTDRYLYNDKERIKELNVNWMDYGARYYDPMIGRWNGVDPLAEKFNDKSGYAYVSNNPVRFLDPLGLEEEDSNDDSENSKEFYWTDGYGTYSSKGTTASVSFYGSYSTNSTEGSSNNSESGSSSSSDSGQGAALSSGSSCPCGCPDTPDCDDMPGYDVTNTVFAQNLTLSLLDMWSYSLGIRYLGAGVTKMNAYFISKIIAYRASKGILKFGGNEAMGHMYQN
jgi:RHS repeat-associated protein